MAESARFIILILVLATLAQAQVPAFPGAEGFGAVAVGGRGGEVYHVTNLNDSGPGSFREALLASGPRTVVFDVSGVIWLTEDQPIYLQNPYITIAGQTAPGNGILIAGATIEMTGGVSEVICRYIRVRRGFDAVKGQCMVGMSATRNLIMDHMSVSWGTDENFSMYRRNIDGKLVPTKNITVQWCINAEALDPFNHAFACTWGGQGFNAHHNLLACCTGRNPSLSFSHFVDYRNNVIFNWRDRTMDGAGIEAHVNVINNYYKPGPATGYNWDWSLPFPELFVRIVKPEIRVWANAVALGLDPKARYAGPGVIGWWYVNGNIVEGYPEVSSDNWYGQSLVSGSYYRGVQWDAIVQPYPGVGPEIGEAHPEWAGDYMTDHPEWVRSDSIITHAEWPENPYDPEDGNDGEIFVMPDLPLIATQSAQDAYYTVLTRAGANLPQLDAVDQRVIQMVSTGQATGGPRGNGIIIRPDEVGGFPVIPEVHRPGNWDTDLDGMPGEWESARGLDPNDPADRDGDYDNDGYTNLEEYLNDIGAFPAVQAIVWDGEVSNRYARIENWDIAFQPSRFDTAIISGATVDVDVIDQHAGILQLTDGATLNITDGWLDVATRLETDEGTLTDVGNDGTMIVADILNNGLFRLTGDASLTVSGTFTNNGIIDISEWNGTLPPNLVNLGTIVRYSCAMSIVSDLNDDCQVDFVDYARMAEAWAGDVAGWLALQQFAQDWLICNRDPASECWQ